MATVDLSELVSAVKVTTRAICGDCSWRLEHRRDDIVVERRARMHAAHRRGHRVVITETVETAVTLP